MNGLSMLLLRLCLWLDIVLVPKINCYYMSEFHSYSIYLYYKETHLARNRRILIALLMTTVTA